MLVDKACVRISEGLRERAGRAGCLEGEQIDYLDTLEGMLNMMNAAFAKNRARLKAKIYGVQSPKVDSSADNINNWLSAMKEQI